MFRWRVRMCDIDESRILGTTKLKQMILSKLRLNLETSIKSGDKKVDHRAVLCSWDGLQLPWVSGKTFNLSSAK